MVLLTTIVVVAANGLAVGSASRVSSRIGG
jgi:hypothetical protein